MSTRIKLTALALMGLAIVGCNCSPTNSKYRCNSTGIVEVQAPMEFSWKPVSGAAIVRCMPGQPISPENLK